MRLFLAALLLLAGTLPAAAQWLDRPWPGIPRTADGQPDLSAPAPRGADGRPDLSGVWDASPPLVRLDEATLQPWVADLVRQRQDEFYKTRPFYQCRPSGPEAQRYGEWKRFLHTPHALAILNDDLTYRVVHLDGRELEPDPLPSWQGYSVGRWDGDTLVVDSNGYNDKTWVSRFGVSHTEALSITERYRRPDLGHLEVEVTFTDPGAFTRPWSFTVDMELAADTEMLEAVCETGTETWGGSLSEAADEAVTVPPDVLARYVGTYTGIYAGSERTYEVSVVDGDLFATIVGDNTGVGLAAAGLDEAAPRPLVPRSETLFEGLGLAYRFVVNDAGEVTDLIMSHVSGDYRYARRR
jgi:hypothetical protein